MPSLKVPEVGGHGVERTFDAVSSAGLPSDEAYEANSEGECRAREEG